MDVLGPPEWETLFVADGGSTLYQNFLVRHLKIDLLNQATSWKCILLVKTFLFFVFLEVISYHRFDTSITKNLHVCTAIK